MIKASPTNIDKPKTNMKIAIIAITKGGKLLASKLNSKLTGSQILSGDKVAKLLKDNWLEFDGFILIMATGIVVRSIAPLLSDKRKDPAIVVMNETGKHAISLLSGHLGGANQLAIETAKLIGAEPVISTSSDCQKLPAIDIWARDNSLIAFNQEMVTTVSAKLVNEGSLQVFVDDNCEKTPLPSPIAPTIDINSADIIITFKPKTFSKKSLILVPQKLVLGIGCKRNTPVDDLENALTELCKDLLIPKESIAKICSIDAKSDELGLLQLAEKLGLEIAFFSKDELNKFSDLTVSKAAMKAVGAIGVAEPAALLGANSNELFMPKRKCPNLTMALAIASLPRDR